MSTQTTLGTPCARSWSPDWIAAIHAKETERNHRICGARLPDGTPCTNVSDHTSGRCPFHGGFDLTGAPKGNRNHTIHGLYSRRLRTCDESCPHWQTCPIAKSRHQDPPAPSALSDPSDSSHPSHNSHSSFICPYQQLEYNTVLTDALAIVESQPHPNPMGLHTAHNVALFQVLLSDAASFLTGGRTSNPRVSPQSSSPRTDSDSSVEVRDSPCSSVPTPPSCDPSPFDPTNLNTINAFIRLSREYRATLKLHCSLASTPLNRQNNEATPLAPEGILRHAQRIQHDTGLDPDSIADAQLEPQTIQTHARAFVQEAALFAGEGREVAMCETFDNATMLDEPFANSERDHVLASYRPAKHSVPQEMADKILGHLHLPPRTDATGLDGSSPSTGSTTSTESTDFPEPTKVLLQFIDLCQNGKIPPETFPLRTPVREFVEKLTAGSLS